VSDAREAALTAENAFTTVRFSDRSKFGAARIWLPERARFDPRAKDGWPVVIRLHGGNGNDQGNLDPKENTTLQALRSQLGAVIVSINWQDNGFYEQGGQDPRALFFPDGLLEPALITPWLLARRRDAALFGDGGFITDDPRRIALYGISDGGWRAALLAYGNWRANGVVLRQPDVLIATQGHFDLEHFWMSEPVDALRGWSVARDTQAGAETLELAGGAGTWRVGHELVFEGHRDEQHLVLGSDDSGLRIWPALREDVPQGVAVSARDNGLSKYAKGGYSWAGAPLFRAGGALNWANFPLETKRAASLWPLIERGNRRVERVLPLLLYPPAERFITNDDDALSGWKTWLNSVGANPRYKNLHSEANAFALAGLLAGLGHTQGVGAHDRYLLRAGGPRSNPDASTRFNADGVTPDAAVVEFLLNHGW
jgi:hypothetical protein